MSKSNNPNRGTSKQQANSNQILHDMKEWIHSLSLQQLLDAMVFSLSTASNEYNLLVEMLSTQSPPPIPIHPKAVGYKQHATNQPITDGRLDEEQRVLRNRFERPRLFQFIERSYPLSSNGVGGKDDLSNIDISGLGLPAEITAMLQAERKNTMKSKKQKGNSNHQHRITKRCHEYDVLAKKFIAAWGDVYSLGSTIDQREADIEILAGTHIQYGVTLSTPKSIHQTSDCFCKFDPTICLVAGKTRIKKKLDKDHVIKMLHIASRGRFLSSTPDNQGGETFIYWAPWLHPTKEWFSLPLYLASRFESALWSSFQSSLTKFDVILPQTLIEKSCMSMSEKQIRQYLLESICRSLRRHYFQEISVVGDKIADLSLFPLFLNNNFITKLINEEVVHCNIKTLLSIQLVHLGKSKDCFRKQLIRSFEEVLREEAEKYLVNSCPKLVTETIPKETVLKRSNRKKKKNRRRQPRPSHINLLNSIDEKNDSDVSDDTVDNDSSSAFNIESRHHNVTSEVYSKDVMFILQIIENIYIDTFSKLGFESDDDVEGGDGGDSDSLTKVTHDGVGQSSMPHNEKVTIQELPEKLESNNGCFPIHENISDNQMTMKRSNLSSYWNKPVFVDEYETYDFFNPLSTQLPLFCTGSSLQQHKDNHVDNYLKFHNFCLDRAFDRAEKSLINDLLDTEQKGHDHFASSTAASIASSMFDLENDQDSNLNHSNHSVFDDELPQDSVQSKEVNEIDVTIQQNIVVDTEENCDTSDACNNDSKSSAEKQKQIDSIIVSNSVDIKEEDSEMMQDEQAQFHSSRPHTPEVGIPSVPLSPIFVSLAELGEIRKLAQQERQGRNETRGNTMSPSLPSSLPGSPKIPTRSWSREDLRIPQMQDDSHGFRRMQSIQSYRNSAKIGLRKTPSICSHDIERSTVQRRHIDSTKFARSVSSLKSFGNEVIIDGSLEFNVCAQSGESALDAHEDSSHWNVIPRIDDDGATTISSFPSAPQETEEVTSLREERDAYRDMCLTLGSEIAKLKNILALEKITPFFMPPRTPSLDYMNTPQSMGPDHLSHFYQNRNRSLDNRFVARSDVGMNNDAQMSEDGTDAFHSSVAATDASGKHRTVNSSNVGNMRLSSISGGRAGSDIASFEHDAGFSVFNPPTSTFILRRESFGPALLHGLQSRLGSEMGSFISSVAAQLEKDSHRRELARKRLTTLVTTLWPRAQVKIYGSHVTGLCLPSSDLDFVICLPAVHKNIPADTPGALEGRNAINESNQKLLARKLKSESWIDPRSIKIIERTVVPVIKVCTKDTKAKSLQLDISFESFEHHGLDAIELVTDTMNHFPMVKPLVLVLKQFLLDKNLLTAYTGGLSSYCLFLMVTKYLQVSSYHGWTDAGVYLMGFLDFYGNHFDPRSQGISVKKNCYFSRRQSFQESTSSSNLSSGQPGLLSYNHRKATYTFDPLYVEDPISQGNNVGRNSFRINQVQRTFSDAHRALVASLEWDMNSAIDFDEGSQLLKCLIQREYSSC